MTLLKRVVIASGVGVFALAVLVGYRMSLPTEPLKKLDDASIQSANSEPQPYEVIFQEGYEICYMHELSCITTGLEEDLSPEQNLPYLSLEKIQAIYGAPQWAVLEKEHKVYLTKLTAEGLCPEHREVMHLGTNEQGEYLTIFYGPSVIGGAGGVYRVTDVTMASIGEEQREKIEKGYFELYSKDELLGLLDSFSELE